MAISDQTLSVDFYAEVKAILIAAGIQYNSINAQVLNALDVNYDGTKPTIVINPLETDETFNVFGSTEGTKLINVIITAYFKNTLGVDTLCDSIAYVLKNNKVSGCSLINRIDNLDLNVGNSNKYNSKAITFVYSRS